MLIVSTDMLKPRWRNTRRSTIGCRSVDSQIRNAARPMTATSASAQISAATHQPRPPPRARIPPDRPDLRRLEPVVRLAEVEHELQRADRHDQQHETDFVDRQTLQLLL